MSFQTTFRLLTQLTVLWAFLALVATGQVHLLVIAFFAVVFTLAVLRPRLGFRVPRWVSTVMSIGVFGIALYVWFAIGERMYAVTYFFVYMVLDYLLTAEKNREYLQTYALSFFLILAASVSTESVLFAPMLAVYLFLVIGAMIVFTIRRDATLAFAGARSGAMAVATTPRRLTRSDSRSMERLNKTPFADGRFALWMIFLTSFVLVVGTMVFWIVPRVSTTNFLPGLSGREDGPRRSGFAETVNFSGLGEIQNDPTIVMRATPLAQYVDRRPEFLRIRGTSLDYFSGRQWSKSPTLADRIALRRDNGIEFPPPRTRGDSFRVRMVVEPESSRYVFQVDRPRAVQFDDRVSAEVDFEHQSVVLGRMRFQPIAYDSEGYLPLRTDALANVPDDDASVSDSFTRRPGVPLMLDATLHLVDRIANPPDRAGTGQGRGRFAMVEPAYLQLPRVADMTAVEQLAREWTADSTSRLDSAQIIERRLQREYEYSLNVPFTNQADHLTHFLVEARSGHCEYFATSMALMLRSIGIPSRIVNGYLTDEWSGGQRRYLVRQEHAHSWVEAYINDGLGWVTFDPTPASGVGSNRIRTSIYHRFSSMIDGLRMVWYERVVDYNHTNQRLAVFAVLRQIARARSATFDGVRSLQTLLREGSLAEGAFSRRQITGLTLFLLGAVVVGGLVVKRRRNARAARRGESPTRQRIPPAAVRSFLQLMEELEGEHPRRSSQPPLAWARDVADRDDTFAELPRLTQSYYQARYRGAAWSGDLDELVARFRKALADRTAPKATP